MKTDTKNVRLIYSDVQSGANIDLIVYTSLDPYDRNAGFVLRALELNLEVTDLSDIAADASIKIQAFAATSAVPTAEFALGDKRIIWEYGLSIPLNTNGEPAIETHAVWTPPDGVDLVIGAEYQGYIVATAGLTSALLSQMVFYGDAVTLTTDEIAQSRLRFI